MNRPRTTEAGRVRARYAGDPVAFCSEIIGGDRPWSRQTEVLEAVRDHRRTAVRSGHGVGKSWTCARVALWWLLTRASSVVITTAPTERQVREVLWREIGRAYAGSRVPLGGKLLSAKMQLAPDWFALGCSTDEAERFQGFHSEHLLVIFDEAAGVPQRMWEAAEGMLSSGGSRMLAVGNPTAPSGPFHSACQSAEWRQVCVSCEEAAREAGRLNLKRLVSEEWIAERRRDWGVDSPVFRARVLGEFPSTAESGLIPGEWIAEATERGKSAEGDEEGRRGERVALGVDVARFGADSTAMVLRRGARVLETLTFHGLDTMEVAGKVVRMARKHSVDWRDVYVDACGLGAGVVDRLREQGFGVPEVNVSVSARNSAEFENLRAELYWRLRDALSPSGAQRLALGPEAGALARQLHWIRYRVSSSGRIRIEAKDRIRALEGASPDLADALALTYAGYSEQEAPGLWVI